jgi:hypothetical protein
LQAGQVPEGPSRLSTTPAFYRAGERLQGNSFQKIFAAARFADAALKSVERAVVVGRRGLGLGEHVEEIEKVPLARAPL